MKAIPTLHTERLTLRPFTLDDAADVQRLAGDKDIASTTCAIPHPYEDGMAEEWINRHTEVFENGRGLNLAITLKDTDISSNTKFIGAISVEIDNIDKIGELGYWIGKPYWNCGYCTEAAKVILSYAFDVLKLRSIHAFYLKRNPASGRVLQKIGMHFEDCFPKAVERWGVLEDLVKYNIHNNTTTEYSNRHNITR